MVDARIGKINVHNAFGYSLWAARQITKRSAQMCLYAGKFLAWFKEIVQLKRIVGMLLQWVWPYPPRMFSFSVFRSSRPVLTFMCCHKAQCDPLSASCMRKRVAVQVTRTGHACVGGKEQVNCRNWNVQICITHIYFGAHSPDWTVSEHRSCLWSRHIFAPLVRHQHESTHTENA